jgi:hypothetical protein
MCVRDRTTPNTKRKIEKRDGSKRFTEWKRRDAAKNRKRNIEKEKWTGYQRGNQAFRVKDVLLLGREGWK